MNTERKIKISENAVEKNFKEFKVMAINYVENHTNDPLEIDLSSDEAVMASIMSGGQMMGPDIFGVLSAECSLSNAVTDSVKKKYSEVKDKMLEYVKNIKSTGDIEKDNYKVNTILGFVSQLSMVFHFDDEEEILKRLDMDLNGICGWDDYIDDIWARHLI